MRLSASHFPEPREVRLSREDQVRDKLHEGLIQAPAELVGLVVSHPALLDALVDRPDPVQTSSDGAVFGYISPQFLESSGVRWVVKDSDCDLLATLLRGLTGSSVAGWWLGRDRIELSALVGTIVSVFLFLRNLKKKGCHLSELQMSVLRALRSGGRPMTLDELDGRMEWCQVRISRTGLKETLKSLERIRKGTGEIISLVAEDSDNRWAASDV